MNIELFKDMSRLAETISYQCPIVVKGAFVLDALLRKETGEGLMRKTRDIDMNCNTELTQEQLNNIIINSISEIGGNFEVVSVRPFTETRSAGYSIFKDGKPYFEMDISMNSNMFYQTYLTVINTTIKGSSKEKIISDKITALSTNKIFRRTKDLYDLYLLTFLEVIKLPEIIKPLNINNLGDFDSFLNRKSDLEHAYNKLKGIRGKPEFENVYNRVFDFVNIFTIAIQFDQSDTLIWNPTIGIWELN